MIFSKSTHTHHTAPAFPTLNHCKSPNNHQINLPKNNKQTINLVCRVIYKNCKKSPTLKFHDIFNLPFRAPHYPTPEIDAMCATRTNFNPLAGLPEEVLADFAKPFYEEFLAEIDQTEAAKINYDEVIKRISLEINEQTYSPIEVYGSEISANLFASSEAADITIDLQKLIKGATSPCAMAVYATIGDVVGLVFGLLGVNTTVSKNATRKLLREMNGGNLNGLMSKLNDIAKAGSLYERVKEIIGLMGQIKNAIGGTKLVKAIVGEMNMKPWQWVATCTKMGIQLAAWFASDGLALAAQLALSTFGIAETVEDAAKAVNVCQV
ncbi:hypothetical protein [Burkholderia cenocepacia]|uniref:hypothetical protein n=1 Tax=Burkholderia cenocepacia TaxID=95486 RepID=UPI00222FF478|nr:hypothetical protein [Burkholderia cenocepacia]MCW3609107.1 hypothetical protein [Burkholderia cenocepacia]MCW5189941.1 hypothetical protein [Burkholderia cenocepacia]